MAEQEEEDLFQFCSSLDEDVKNIVPTVDVYRMWLGQVKHGMVSAHEAAADRKGASKKRRRRRRNEAGASWEDEEDTAEDYFVFSSHPARTTKSSLTQLDDQVLKKAFLTEEAEDDDDESRNAPFAEHRDLLHQRLTHSFTKWMLQMQAGFNLLLYGFGSKMRLIDEFARTALSLHPVLTIEGFTPTTTIRNVLSMISQSVLGITRSMPAEPSEHFRVLQSIFLNEDEAKAMRVVVPEHLYIIVHNIDGLALRNPSTQTILSRLAAIPQIHMVASVDHAYAPILWNHIMVGHFNWVWHDATTFEPYTHEGEANLALYKSFGKNEIQSGHKSVRYVLGSVPLNAKRIFKLLATAQLQKIKEAAAVGARGGARRAKAITLNEFSSLCEQNLLAGGRDALKGHLREFIDHKIVKKVGKLGDEVIYVDMAEKELQSVLEGELANVD